MTEDTEHDDEVYLPDAPAIPGLRFRRFRGKSDYPHMVEVFEGSREADRLEYAVSVDHFEREYEHVERCDPFRDFIIVEVGSEVVGYTELWWDKDPSGNYLYNQHALLLPEWRSTGLRNAMLRHNERRLRDIARDQPEDGPRLFQSVLEDSEVDWITVLEGEGYKVFRHGYRMVRQNLENIPDLPLPEGVDVRPVRPEHYRQIVDAWNEACKDMRGQIPFTDESFKSFQESPVFDPSLWRIAWHDSEVIGTVIGYIDAESNKLYDRRRGSVEFISVKRPWRGRGIAKALIAMSLKAVKERGMTQAIVGVDAENPSGAVHLYKHMGFEVVKRATFYRKKMD